MNDSLDGKYELGKTLGKGQFSKVRIGVKIENKNKFAIKIIERDNPALDDRFLKLIQAEVTTLSKLSHPHIVNMYDYNENGIVTASPSGIQKKVLFMALELVPNGELFDYLATTGKFSEPMCRLYFSELLNVLQYIHKLGICHRDLKAENIMLDKEYKLKLLDFGFSALNAGKTGDGMLNTYLGTPTYMAPEIHAGGSYKGEAADVFASGVLLFIMLTGRPPFKSAKPSDPYYKYIGQGANEKFWMIHSKSLPGGEKFFSDDIKNLLNSMLAYDSGARIKLDAISTHPWLKGAVPDDKSRFGEFDSRHKTLQEIATRNSQVPTVSSPVPVGAFRADDPVFVKQIAECEKKPLLDFYEYDPSVFNPCSFYCKYNPNFIVLKLGECAEKMLHPIGITLHKKKYKLAINIAGEHKQCCVIFKISKCEKGYFVEVTKAREADKNDFTNMYIRMFNPENKDSASVLRTITA